MSGGLVPPIGGAVENTGISVVVPLYNKAAFVRRALDSVFRQTYPAFEVIVVDDGSTDRGPELVELIEEPRLRLVRQANAGPGSARNAGIALCRYGRIALLDADDIWMPGHLAELSRLFDAFPKAGMVSSSYCEVTNGAVVRETSRLQSRQPRPVRREYQYLREWRRDCRLVWTSCVGLRKVAAAEVGGFPDYMPGEDTELWIRLAAGHQVAVSSQITALYVRDLGGAIQSRTSRNRRSTGDGFVFEANPIYMTLIELMDGESSDERRSDLHRHLNERLMLSFRSSVLRENLTRARQVLDRIDGPMRMNMRLWKVLFAVLPDVAIRRTTSLSKRLRDAVRTLRAGHRRVGQQEP